jgi:GT2 family glycosyltransferase
MSVIIVVHDFKRIVRVEGSILESVDPKNKLTQQIIELSQKNKDSRIVWVHKDYYQCADMEFIKNYEMLPYEICSFAPEQMDYIPPEIGLVDQSVFVNISKQVKYPTWIMSSIVGLATPDLFKGIDIELLHQVDFDFFLNVFTKQNMPLGLRCYSQPKLIKKHCDKSFSNKMSAKELFCFLILNNKPFWSYLLAFHFIISFRSEFFGFIGALLVGKKTLNFRNSEWFEETEKINYEIEGESVDVLIPTLGRPEYLREFLNDLKNQTLLPKRVIIIEQRPKGTVTELNYLVNESWPFQIIHRCIYEFGACNARNIGLKEVKSKWLFFADDDISIEDNFLELTISRLKFNHANCASSRCISSKNDFSINEGFRQWQGFSTNSSIINVEILNIDFDKRFEFGFGEDSDFGMRLRKNGNDVLYFSEPSILHYKAPSGGFRQKIIKPWDSGKIMPKPSPTVMLFNLLHQTPWQRLGYKYIYFLKNLRKKNIPELIGYLKNFQKHWKSSVYWAYRLKESK